MNPSFTCHIDAPLKLEYVDHAESGIPGHPYTSCRISRETLGGLGSETLIQLFIPYQTRISVLRPEDKGGHA